MKKKKKAREKQVNVSKDSKNKKSKLVNNYLHCIKCLKYIDGLEIQGKTMARQTFLNDRNREWHEKFNN